jgi:DNA-binding protein HU-beta
MHKTDFIKRLARKHKRPQTYYHRPLKEILEEIQEILAEGKSLTFLGFGTFSTRMRPPSKIRDIKTKIMKDVPALRMVQFSVGDVLKRVVRKRTPQAAKSKKAKSLFSLIGRH